MEKFRDLADAVNGLKRGNAPFNFQGREVSLQVEEDHQITEEGRKIEGNVVRKWVHFLENIAGIGKQAVISASHTPAYNYQYKDKSQWHKGAQSEEIEIHVVGETGFESLTEENYVASNNHAQLLAELLTAQIQNPVDLTTGIAKRARELGLFSKEA